MRPAVVEADFPLVAVGVPLAGRAHVLVFVVDEAGGPAGFVGHERGHHRRNRGLRFLAAECRRPSACRCRRPGAGATPSISATTTWISVGVLRRRMDDDLPLLAGVGDRGLRLEIKLLLAETVEHAAQPVRGRLRSPSPASPRAMRRAGPMKRPSSIARSIDRIGSVGRRVDLDRFLGGAERFARFGGDHDDRLADVQQFAVGQHRLVFEHRAEVLFAGNVGRGVQADDAGNSCERRPNRSRRFVPLASGLPTKPTSSSSDRGGRSSRYGAVPVTWPTAESCGMVLPTLVMVQAIIRRRAPVRDRTSPARCGSVGSGTRRCRGRR